MIERPAAASSSSGSESNEIGDSSEESKERTTLGSIEVPHTSPPVTTEGLKAENDIVPPPGNDNDNAPTFPSADLKITTNSADFSPLMTTVSSTSGIEGKVSDELTSPSISPTESVDQVTTPGLETLESATATMEKKPPETSPESITTSPSDSTSSEAKLQGEKPAVTTPEGEEQTSAAVKTDSPSQESVTEAYPKGEKPTSDTTLANEIDTTVPDRATKPSPESVATLPPTSASEVGVTDASVNNDTRIEGPKNSTERNGPLGATTLADVTTASGVAGTEDFHAGVEMTTIPASEEVKNKTESHPSEDIPQKDIDITEKVEVTMPAGHEEVDATTVSVKKTEATAPAVHNEVQATTISGEKVEAAMPAGHEEVEATTMPGKKMETTMPAGHEEVEITVPGKKAETTVPAGHEEVEATNVPGKKVEVTMPAGHDEVEATTVESATGPIPGETSIPGEEDQSTEGVKQNETLVTSGTPEVSANMTEEAETGVTKPIETSTEVGEITTVVTAAAEVTTKEQDMAPSFDSKNTTSSSEMATEMESIATELPKEDNETVTSTPNFTETVQATANETEESTSSSNVTESGVTTTETKPTPKSGTEVDCAASSQEIQVKNPRNKTIILVTGNNRLRPSTDTNCNKTANKPALSSCLRNSDCSGEEICINNICTLNKDAQLSKSGMTSAKPTDFPKGIVYRP